MESMKERMEIILAGIGGQGLILAGKILGEAAVIDGKNAVQTQSYGIASRGGFSKAEVVISEKDIAYPEVMEPDVVLALSQQAFDMYKDTIGKECLLIYDSDSIEKKSMVGNAEGYPITSTAVNLNNLKIINMIALGIIIKRVSPVSLKAIEISLKKNSPEKFVDINIKAFQTGFSMVDK